MRQICRYSTLIYLLDAVQRMIADLGTSVGKAHFIYMYFTVNILKDLRNAPPAYMLIHVEILIFSLCEK